MRLVDRFGNEGNVLSHQDRRHNAKITWIALRTGSSSTIFSRFGPLRLLTISKPKKMARRYEVYWMRRSLLNREPFWGLLEIVLFGGYRKIAKLLSFAGKSCVFLSRPIHCQTALSPLHGGIGSIFIWLLVDFSWFRKIESWHFRVYFVLLKSKDFIPIFWNKNSIWASRRCSQSLVYGLGSSSVWTD